MILPALLLTLDKYSSWRVGRVVQMIRSAVRSTLRRLLRSDLEAELNQTVIDTLKSPEQQAYGIDMKKLTFTGYIMPLH